jgi:PleD family two-component response regulator
MTVGVAVFPKDGDDCRSLLANADLALYRAKEQGRNRVVATPPRSRWGGDRSPSSIGAG